MKPWRWVRWKVVIVLAVLVGLVSFLGLDKIAYSKINSAGSTNQRARWNVAGVALGLLGGSAELNDLEVAAARGKSGGKAAGQEAAAVRENVFNTAAAKFDLSMTSLLRGRCVIDEVELRAPKLTVTRREDGTINVEDLGEPAPQEPGAPATKPLDWLESIKKWHERLKKIREKLPRGGEDEARKEKKPGVRVDYDRGVSYPFEGRPGVVVRKVVGSGFEIQFKEDGAGGGAGLPPLTNGTLTIEEVSSRPSVHGDPVRFEIKGDLGASPVKVAGSLDLRGEKSDLDLKVDLGSLPAALVEAFVGPSLPVHLQSGTVGLSATLKVDGAGGLDVQPKLALKGITLEPKDPKGKIASIDAVKFTTAFNQASRELDELVIDDLRISGTLSSPRFEWGDTVRNMLVSGSKAFASKQVEKGLEQGKEALSKELDKLPVGGEAKEKLKEVDVKGLEKGLKGLFGGSKEKAAEAEKK